MSRISPGFAAAVFLATLGLAGCQEEKPVVKLDDALRTTAQFRLGQEMTAPVQASDTSPSAATNFWNEAEGGETEIETADIPEGTPLAQARNLYRSLVRGGRRVSPVQRIREFERVLSLIEGNRGRVAVALRRDTYYALGFAHNTVNDLRAAASSMKEAAQLYETTKTFNSRYFVVLQHGGSYAASTRDLATADAMLVRARALEAQLSAEKDGQRLQPLYRARVAALEGWIHFIKRDFAAAERNLQASLAGFEEMQARRAADPSLSDFRAEMAGLQARRSRSLESLGRLAEAETAMLQAIRLFTELDGRNSSSVATHLRVLAANLARQNRQADREKVASDAVAVLENMGRTDESLELNMARLAHASALAGVSRFPEALKLFDQAYAAMRLHTPDRLYSGFQHNYISLLARSGRAGEAVRMADGYVRFLVRTTGAESFDTAVGRAYRANARARLGDRRAALDEFREVAPRIFSDDDTAVDEELGALGRQVLWRNLSIEFLDVAASTAAVEAGDRDLLIREAFAVGERIRLGGTARALAAAAERQAVRDPVVADLVRRDQNAGLEHARLLRRIAELNRGQLGESERAEIAAAGQRVPELEAARRELRAAIRQRAPDFAARTSTQVSSLDDVRAALGEDEAMLALFVAGPKTYVWAFRREGQVQFAEVALSHPQIVGTVANLRKPVDTPVSELRDIPSYDVGSAYALYRDLLLPVRQGWEGARTLVVVSHGPLSQIPFHMLVTAPTEVGADDRVLFDRYTKVPFLAKTMAVAQMPSATSLVQLRAQRASTAAREAFVGFGDALFNQRQAADAARQAAAVQTRGVERIAMRSVRTTEDGQPFDAVATRSRIFGGLARLPETADELRAVATALGADPAKDVFLGVEANETRVRTMDLSRKRIVMFATHGLLAGDIPGLTQPALALTSPEVAKIDGDGLLTLDNIMGLRLNADWVVLSACNTAGGDGANAEAISGLGRAFFYAGTRALLVTNWAVETTAAQTLTTTLFREQATFSISRGEALRRTMVGMIERGAYVSPTTGRTVFSYAHPLFWAPYSLIGDPASNQPRS